MLCGAMDFPHLCWPQDNTHSGHHIRKTITLSLRRAWHARCICSNERAVVLMMKGADPVYQLDLRADPPCIKSQRPGKYAFHSNDLATSIRILSCPAKIR